VTRSGFDKHQRRIYNMKETEQKPEGINKPHPVF